jgi:hypothetical protein
MGGNIKIDLKQLVCEGMPWIKLTQYGVQCQPFLNTVINPQIPLAYTSDYQLIYRIRNF